MKIKTSELTGSALDWAVAKATAIAGPCQVFEGDPRIGFAIADSGHRKVGGLAGVLKLYTIFENGEGDWRPSTDWAQGGPLIERFQLDIWHRVEEADGNDWHASCRVPFERFQRAGYEEDEDGPTPLIAAMRAIVAAKLGEEVEVPDELVSYDAFSRHCIERITANVLGPGVKP